MAKFLKSLSFNTKGFLPFFSPEVLSSATTDFVGREEIFENREDLEDILSSSIKPTNRISVNCYLRLR